MLLYNRPFQTTQSETEPTVPLCTLTHGKYKHTMTGNVSAIVKRDETSITIKRHDGWLVTVCEGDLGWDGGVIIVK